MGKVYEPFKTVKKYSRKPIDHLDTVEYGQNSRNINVYVSLRYSELRMPACPDISRPSTAVGTNAANGATNLGLSSRERCSKSCKRCQSGAHG